MLILTSTLSLGFNFLLAIQLGISNELDIYIYSLALPTFISSLIVGSIQYRLGPEFVNIFTPEAEDLFHKTIRTIIIISSGFLLLGLIALPYQAYALLSVTWFSGSIMILMGCTVAILNGQRRFLMALSLSIYPYLLPTILLFILGSKVSPVLVVVSSLVGYCISLVIGMFAIDKYVRWKKLINIADLDTDKVGALVKTLPTLFCFSSFAIIDAFWAIRMNEGSLSILGLCQRIIISSGSLVITSPMVKMVSDIMSIKHQKDLKSYFKSLFSKLVILLSLLILVIFMFRNLIATLLIRDDITNTRARLVETLGYMLPGMAFMLLSAASTRALYCFPENSSKLSLGGLGWAILYFTLSMILVPLNTIGSAIAYSTSWLIYLSFCMVLLRKQLNLSR
jgi:putative peptidoglycan lipid II flippase